MTSQHIKTPKHNTDWQNELLQSVAEDLSTSPYDVVRYIATGAYGSVFEGRHRSTGDKVAIKQVANIFESHVSGKRFLREVKILKMLSPHPNIINLQCIVQSSKDPHAFLMILDYAPSDLFCLFRSKQYFTNHHIQYFMYQLLCAVHYIHSAGCVHRDLKPENILINADCHLRVCDFNHARIIKDVRWGEKSHRSNPSSPSGPSDKSNDFDKYNPSNQSEFTVAKTRKGKQERMMDQESKKSKADVRPVELVDTTPQYSLFPELQRVMTEHITTRHYRAPEVICCNKNYGPPVDMWATGAILAELMMMIKKNGFSFAQRRPFFPGKSCYPLSFDAKCGPEVCLSATDQLQVIFNQIGTPCAEQVKSVEGVWLHPFLSSLDFTPRLNFRHQFPASDPLALDLLDKMFQFDPTNRISAWEALHHPYFSDFAPRPFTMNLHWQSRLEMSSILHHIVKEQCSTFRFHSSCLDRLKHQEECAESIHEYMDIEFTWQQQQVDDLQPLTYDQEKKFISTITSPITHELLQQINHTRLRFQQYQSQIDHKTLNNKCILDMLVQEIKRM